MEYLSTGYIHSIKAIVSNRKTKHKQRSIDRFLGNSQHRQEESESAPIHVRISGPENESSETRNSDSLTDTYLENPTRREKIKLTKRPKPRERIQLYKEKDNSDQKETDNEPLEKVSNETQGRRLDSGNNSEDSGSDSPTSPQKENKQLSIYSVTGQKIFQSQPTPKSHRPMSTTVGYSSVKPLPSPPISPTRTLGVAGTNNRGVTSVGESVRAVTERSTGATKGGTRPGTGAGKSSEVVSGISTGVMAGTRTESPKVSRTKKCQHYWEWTTEEVADWLLTKKLDPEYFHIFLKNKVNGKKLDRLTEPILYVLGVVPWEARLHILDAVEDLQKTSVKI